VLCIIVKNSLPWERGENRGKVREEEKRKMPSIIRGRNTKTAWHIVMDTIMIEHIMGCMLDHDLIEGTP